MTTYKINDAVEVNLPRGWTVGKVKKVLPNYGFIGQQETKYEVHGTGKIKFLTITSARQIRPLKKGEMNNETTNKRRSN